LQTRLLDRDDTVLVVIDVQEAYRDKTVEHARMVERVRRLIAAARIFAVPIVVSEQYPQGLGHTQAEVVEELPPQRQLIEKMTMSCCAQPSFARLLADLRRWQIVVCGIEAHACVNQTVHELLERGYQVHLPWDAISSRFQRDADVAWEKMIGSGAVPSSTEMICLEWVRSAAAPEFKAVHKLIK